MASDTTRFTRQTPVLERDSELRPFRIAVGVLMAFGRGVLEAEATVHRGPASQSWPSLLGDARGAADGTQWEFPMIAGRETRHGWRINTQWGST